MFTGEVQHGVFGVDNHNICVYNLSPFIFCKENTVTYMIDQSSFDGTQTVIVGIIIKMRVNFDTTRNPLRNCYKVLERQKRLMPLPGGSHYQYFIIDRDYDFFVGVCDPTVEKVIGVIHLHKITNGVYKEFHTSLLKQYHGKRLGMAMYGIVLDICEFSMMSGDTQTPNGYGAWLKLATVPGISVRGVSTIHRIHKTTTNKQITDIYKGHSVYDVYQDRDVRDKILQQLQQQFPSFDGSFVEGNHNYVTFPVEIVDNEFSNDMFTMVGTSDTWMIATYETK